MKNNKLKKWLFIILIFIILLGLVLIINKLFLNQSEISFHPLNSSITLEKINNNQQVTSSFKTNTDLTKSFSNGYYEVIYQSNNPNYQIVTSTIDLTSNISLKTPTYYYSNSYLNQMLTSQINQIHLAFNNSVYGYLITKSGYSYGYEKLLGNGNWYIARLYPLNPLTQDSLVYVMEKVSNNWIVKTTPSVVLYSGNYPSIPVSYLQTINNTSYSSNTSQDLLSTTLLPVVNEYIKAREDSVGSNQSSASSWLNTVQPILSASFYNQLVSSYNNSLTGQESNDYIIAHSNNFIITTALYSCVYQLNTTSTATVNCSLNDTVEYQQTNSIVPVANIPFGFLHSGIQPYISVGLINQNGQWLINSDTMF